MSKGFIRTNISFTLTRKSFTLKSKDYIYSFRWGENGFACGLTILVDHFAPICKAG